MLACCGVLLLLLSVEVCVRRHKVVKLADDLSSGQWLAVSVSVRSVSVARCQCLLSGQCQCQCQVSGRSAVLVSVRSVARRQCQPMSMSQKIYLSYLQVFFFGSQLATCTGRSLQGPGGQRPGQVNPGDLCAGQIGEALIVTTISLASGHRL